MRNSLLWTLLLSTLPWLCRHFCYNVYLHIPKQRTAFSASKIACICGEMATSANYCQKTSTSSEWIHSPRPAMSNTKGKKESCSANYARGLGGKHSGHTSRSHHVVFPAKPFGFPNWWTRFRENHLRPNRLLRLWKSCYDGGVCGNSVRHQTTPTSVGPGLRLSIACHSKDQCPLETVLYCQILNSRTHVGSYACRLTRTIP